jgi:hypothetical protein
MRLLCRYLFPAACLIAFGCFRKSELPVEKSAAPGDFVPAEAIHFLPDAEVDKILEDVEEIASERKVICDRLQLMVRSSPSDKSEYTAAERIQAARLLAELHYRPAFRDLLRYYKELNSDPSRDPNSGEGAEIIQSLGTSILSDWAIMYYELNFNGPEYDFQQSKSPTLGLLPLFSPSLPPIEVMAKTPDVRRKMEMLLQGMFDSAPSDRMSVVYNDLLLIRKLSSNARR